MEEVQIRIDENGDGGFYIIEENEQLGEMIINKKDNALSVLHTEVLPKAEGRGLAKKMLESMVDYARENALKVVPLCSYVHLQFRRRPEQYADIWQKKKHGTE